MLQLESHSGLALPCTLVCELLGIYPYVVHEEAALLSFDALLGKWVQ